MNTSFFIVNFVSVLVIIFVEIEVVFTQNVTELVLDTTQLPTVLTSPSAVPSTTRKPIFPAFRMPCQCAEGQCGCCTGYILDRLNQKACLNMTYEPEEFAIHAKMYLNDVPFFDRTFSGKNPPPICIRPPRFRFIQVCAEFSNVYFNNRNIHMCIDAEANWQDFTLIEWSFDCIRMGASGFQVISPEDGGGIPEKPVDSEEQIDEDYDDSARNNPLISVEEKQPKVVFHRSLKKLEGKCCDPGLVQVKKTRNGDFLLVAKVKPKISTK